MSLHEEVRELFDDVQSSAHRTLSALYGPGLHVWRVKDRNLYKREWMRAVRAKLPRKRSYVCRRCDGTGHNQRTCESAGMRLLHLTEPTELIAFVNGLLHRHRHTSGTGFKASWQPKSTWVEEHTIVAVRHDDNEGGHLIGLLELNVLDVRVAYAFKTYQGLMNALAARLRERFR